MRIILFLAFTLLAAAIHGQHKFIIKGELENPGGSTSVILKRGTKDTVSIAPIINGKFTLEGVIDKPAEKLVLTVIEGSRTAKIRGIWVAVGENTIKGTSLPLISLWDVQNASEEQQEANMYIAASYNDILERETLQARMRPLYIKYSKKDISEEEKAKLQPEVNDLQTRIKAISDRILQTELGILEKCSVVTDLWMSKLDTQSDLLVKNKEEAFVAKIYTLYDRMNASQKASKSGQSIATNLRRYELVGKPLPDAQFKDLEGNVFHFSSCKGKYLLIDFWASWCGPCIRSFPQLKNLKEKYAENLNVVSVNLDGDYELWKTASAKHGLKWGNISEGKAFKTDDGFHKACSVQGIPYYILVSPQGIVLDCWSGYNSNPSVMDNRVKKQMIN